MRAHQIMTRTVITVSPEAGIVEAADIMLQRHVSGLPVVDAAGKLARWKKRLLKRSRKLRRIGARERHRLRLLNKKLTCSIDSFEDLFDDKKFARQKIALKHLPRPRDFSDS